ERLMARAAAHAVRLGARAIDLNFGCPSKTVNRHDGGATLLKYPERIRAIVAAVRAEVDRAIPVSAKMRLGWEEREDIYRNAVEAEAGGASWITIHARTKRQGYAPPAYWSYIREVRERVSVPVVANGDIWSLDDFKRCREETGAIHFMIGRGALADPSLPLKIARELGLEAHAQADFAHAPSEWEPLLARFNELNVPVLRKGQEAVLGRMKQWLKFAHLRQPLAWFDDVKRTESIDDFFAVLRR
ncbi:MAG TPA: tRNA-dihydrouridine synthase family protein, partial [Bdellovibrionales bacterium]|nr:tRNA-dihydrouridine synthase family protein [Bdellovibrionales bacterium]